MREAGPASVSTTGRLLASAIGTAHAHVPASTSPSLVANYNQTVVNEGDTILIVGPTARVEAFAQLR